MTTLLDDLTTPLTVDECKAAIYATIEARGTSTTAWEPGAVARTIIAGVSIVLAAMSVLIALIAKSGFLSLSEGDWLTVVAREIYSTTRIEAVFATGTVTIDNASGNVYSIAAGDLILLNTTTGATYRNTATVNIGSAETGVSAAVQADQHGSAGAAAAGQIDDLVTAYLGLSVTNEAAIIGTDAESDPALVERAQEQVGSLSPNGPGDAYSYFAKGAVRAADGTSVGVTRVKATPDGNGDVDVLVATAVGAVTGDWDDPDTDLGAVHLAMELNAVPLGVTLSTASATATTVNVVAELWIDERLADDDDAITASVMARLTTLMATTPIGGVVIPPAGGKLYLQAIEAAISAAVSGYLVDLEVATPAADASVTSTHALVMGTLSLTINRVVV